MLICITVCGVGRKTRIVGGNVTSIHEYPWLVSMTKKGMFYCAGSVISRKHVLTAAHCLEGYISSKHTHIPKFFISHSRNCAT